MQTMAPRGLTDAQVERSRRLHGANTLTAKKRTGFWRQLLASFGDPIIKILLAALALNLLFLFRSHNWYESVGIAVAIFLATFVSTLSEYGSEEAFLKLQEEASRIQCRVRRSGHLLQLPTDQLVVGDLVVLEAGDRIPADGVLLSGSLMVDQSALNGESKEAKKNSRPGKPREKDLSAPNGLYSGSVVTYGQGLMEVTQVGDHTLYGGIAADLQEDTRESPLRVRLNHLARVLSRIGYVAAALVALADLFNSLVLANGFDPIRMAAALANFPALTQHLLHAATLAITVVVVAVPEGLPMMITVVLSSNMRRMLKDNVLVRKLTGIETSGSLNILFTDKTGTLTRGRLEAERFVTGAGQSVERLSSLKNALPLRELFTLSCALNNGAQVDGGRILGGNATDRALLKAVTPLPTWLKQYDSELVIPFDSSRKYSCSKLSGKRQLFLVKGAPEKLLGQCTRVYNAQGQAVPLLSRQRLEHTLEDLTRSAMRVLALATADRVPAGDHLPPLTLVGFVGIRDSLRPEVKTAVQEAHEAGVQVVMVTGDNRGTAEAIAREAGLLENPRCLVLTSQELQRLPDAEVKEILPRLRVVARALPSDKIRLVKLAQELGLVVGMTGDGINDAPALKRADVGFSMGSGTEVAKESGDIVILDNNFVSITKAILYGRTIFKSIRKFIVFQLTMNLCAVGVSIIGPFIGIDTPVTVIQMLWINIIMDALAGLAFAGETALPEYMHEPPKRRDEPVLTRGMMMQISLMGGYTILLCSLFLKLDGVRAHFRYGEDPIYFMTAFFALFIFCGIFNSFNARTPRLNLLAHLGKNRSFVCIMGAVVVVQILLIYFGGTLFRTAALTSRELGIAVLLAATVLPMDLIRKLILRRLKHFDAAQHY